MKKISMLSEKYDAEPASEKQIRFLKTELSSDLPDDFDWTSITKDKAIRLSSILSKQKSEITIRQPEEPTPNDYLVNSIHDLQLLFPELKGIDPEQLIVSSANNISGYYLPNLDSIVAGSGIKEELHPINISSVIGLGVNIANIFFDFRYEIGLTNISKSIIYKKDTDGIMSQEKGIFINRHRNVLSFSLGVIF